MGAYTFISSRDPVDGDRLVHELAEDLAKAGHTVTLFLVDNGAFLAREGVLEDVKSSLTQAGVEVLADDFALAERGIAQASLSAGVAAARLDVVVDHLADGRNVSWH
jgi:predicted peroxiredoxin